MRLRLLLLACGLMLMSTLVDESQPVARRPRITFPGSRRRRRSTAGSEPCDAVHRGAMAFVDRKLQGLDANGRACADCHMLTDNFQLSPASAEARFQLLQAARQSNPEADDPLFRPIDADDFRINGENASDYSNLRENGLVRITFPLPSNIKLIDPATNAPSDETFVDVWRMVPTVNDVKLTGPDNANPWFRGPNNTGGYQLDGRVGRHFRSRRSARSSITRRFRSRRRSGMLDDLASFQNVLFTSPGVRAALRRHQRRRNRPARSRSAARRARTAGQGRVRARVRPVPRRSLPVQRTAAGHSVPRHRVAVPATRRYASDRRRDPGSIRVRAVPATPRAQRADLRDHAGERDQDRVAPAPIPVARC